MATSGSYDFTVNGDDMIKAALREIGATTPGETPSDEQMSTGREKLNLMLKTWTTHGIQLWLTQKAVLLPEESKAEFLIGSTGDHATTVADLVKTEIRVAVSATDTTIEVDSTTGMTAADNIGIEMDDDTVHWTTIGSITDSDTLVIDDAIDTGESAAVDSHVYTYTTKLVRPPRVSSFFLRQEDGTDIELFQLSDHDYRILADKDTTGVPNQWHYRPELTNGRMFVYPEFNDMALRIYFLAHRQIQDIDAAADTFDLPQEWEEAIKYNLAWRMCPEYGVPMEDRATIKEFARGLLDQVLGFDVETGPVSFGVDFEHDYQ